MEVKTYSLCNLQRDEKLAKQLQETLENIINDIDTTRDITKYVDSIKTIYNKPNSRFITHIFNTLTDNYNETIKSNIEEFVICKNTDLVKLIRDHYVKQIALNRLLLKEDIIPIGLHYKPICVQVDIKHPLGNTIFQITLDSLPYSSFMTSFNI